MIILVIALTMIVVMFVILLMIVITSSMLGLHILALAIGATHARICAEYQNAFWN